MKIALGFFVATLLMVGAAQAQTTDYKSYGFFYKNKGAYTAVVYVKVKNEDGSTTKFKPWCILANAVGASYLTNTATAGQILECKPYQNEKHRGKEYWPYIQITAGDKKSCRKDGFRLILSNLNTKDTFATLTYRTAGTTLNNNRCKVDSVP